MYFKRNEAFRFAFTQAVPGTLTVINSGGNAATDVGILDVSNEGAKLRHHSTIDLTKDAEVSLAFELNGVPFQAPGSIVWIKKYPHSCKLGVHLNTDDDYQKSMMRELKQIAKEQK